MSDSEPSWASETPIVNQAVLYGEGDVLTPLMQRLPDLNKASISTAPIVYLCQLAEAAAVFSADNVAKIFVKDRLLNQFYFSVKPNSVTMCGQNLLLFYKGDVIYLDLVQGTQRTISNPYGRITYAKYVADNRLVLANYYNISYIEVSYMRSIRDMHSRTNVHFYCANERYVACGDKQRVQVFAIYTGKTFVCEIDGQMSALELSGDYLFIGEMTGIVCCYQIEELSFSTRKLKLIKQFKNLKEPVRTISVQPSGKYCFAQAGDEFRLFSLQKMECCALSYFKVVCHCCAWKDNYMLLGKPDGRVWRINIGE